jgi:hypothetical protein
VRHAAAGVVAAVIMTAVSAAAQTTSRPGPWVVDVRGVTSSVPTDTTFYPLLAASVVPTRGFGLDLGAHAYFFELGPARVGLGANLVMVRASAGGASTGDAAASTPGQRLALTMRVIAPQVSFNFGSGDGWSYLSAGVGVASLHTETTDVLPGESESGQLRAVNFGGGARWFISERVAFSIDLRAYQIAVGAQTPRVGVFAVGAGLSIR